MNELLVYVPAHLTDAVVELVLPAAGGATVSPGHIGYWLAPEGDVVKEPVTLVTVLSPTDLTPEVVALLKRNGERAVAYRLNGENRIE